MLTQFTTPKRVMMVMLGEVLLLATLIVTPKLGLAAEHRYTEDLLGLAFGALARGIACKLFLDIADEYRNVRLSRLAWQALAIHAALVFVRAMVTSGAVNLLVPNYYSSPLRGFLNHGLGVPSTIFLLLGLVGLLYSYRLSGLNPKLGARHLTVIVISLSLFSWVLIFHKHLEEGSSPWAINHFLQPADLLLTGAASIVSIVLHRYAAVFNGGKLAEAIRWLVVYGLLPGVFTLLMQLMVPALRQAFHFDASDLVRLWDLFPWMMALAAVARAQMTISAVAQVAKLQRGKSPAEAGCPLG